MTTLEDKDGFGVDSKGRGTYKGIIIGNKASAVRRWDKYFFNLCNAVALNSRCLSRQIGCVITHQHSVVSTGYNGPPRGVPHCPTRLGDDTLREEVFKCGRPIEQDVCPRKSLGYVSGEGLYLCIAAHAEANALVNAARLGVSVDGCVLYLNTLVPCKNCMALIINAGIMEVVCRDLTAYDPIGRWMADSVQLSLRKFEL